MRTHELASALMVLSRVLRDGPDVELKELDLSKLKRHTSHSEADKGAALALLVGLANYGKSEWIALIKEMKLDVSVKATDSTRDLLGRLLKYLAANPDVTTRLTEKSRRGDSAVSPELMKALSLLLHS